MSNTKHRLFTIPIAHKDNIEFEQKAIDLINKFLIEENVVYINHAFSILSKPNLRVSGIVESYNHFAILSLVYKDLKDSDMDLSKASKKIIKTVKKAIEKGDVFAPPAYETSFEKKIKELNNKKKVASSISEKNK